MSDSLTCLDPDQASGSHDILNLTGGAIALGFMVATAFPSIVGSIGDLLVGLATVPDTRGCADPFAHRDFSASRIEGGYAEIFHRIAESSGITA